MEDNADGREMLSVLLAMDGHEVHQAHNAGSGLTLALDVGPDAALSDIGLPGIDGYELTSRLTIHAPGVQLPAPSGDGALARRPEPQGPPAGSSG